MAQCIHCSGWTVVSRDEGIGPCAHVIARVEGPVEQRAESYTELVTELQLCPNCGRQRAENPCEWCDAE